MRHARRLAGFTLIVLLAGCRTSIPAGPAAPPASQEAPTDRQREMAKLSFLSYVGDALTGSDDEVEARLAGCMDAALAAQAPAWELAWGPAVHHFQSKTIDDTLMYVARERANPSHLAVVVRGTNPAVLLNRMVENFSLLDLVDWPTARPAGNPAGPRISKGASEALRTLQKITPAGAPQTTLRDFLAAEARAHSGLRIDVTGHSLGGALAPALALWLSDIQSEWDPRARVSLSVYPLAGPTPGDADFAAYYDERLGSSTERIWNPFDIVPQAWSYAAMATTADLYEPLTRAGLIERMGIEGLRSLVEGKSYTQIDADQEPLSGGLYADNCGAGKIDWTAEAAWQHHWGYQCALGIAVDPAADPACPSKTKPPCADICKIW